MVGLDNLKNVLNELKNQGRIVEWSVIRDTGNVVVFNIGYPTDEDAVMYENYAVRVYNRNTENEYIRWERRKPAFLMQQEASQLELLVDKKKSAVLQDLKEKYNTVKLIGFNIDKEREYITVRAFVDNGDNTISEKEFVVMFDESGNYRIYEKV